VFIRFRLLEYRKQARVNLTSLEGECLRTARSTEVEMVFGYLQHNLGFRGFHLLGVKGFPTMIATNKHGSQTFR
jgi:hypothetical protein